MVTVISPQCGGEPAIPGVAIGHNRAGAWGLTIFGIDAEDLYVYETTAAVAAADPDPDGARGVFAFAVIVPTAIVLNPTKRAQVAAIIDRMRPAHTSYSIVDAVGFRTETAGSLIEVTGIGA